MNNISKERLKFDSWRYHWIMNIEELVNILAVQSGFWHRTRFNPEIATVTEKYLYDIKKKLEKQNEEEDHERKGHKESNTND